MMKDSNCLYNVKHSIYTENCLKSDKETISNHIDSYDQDYLMFTSTFRTTLKEFINFMEQYYISNL